MADSKVVVFGGSGLRGCECQCLGICPVFDPSLGIVIGLPGD